MTLAACLIAALSGCRATSVPPAGVLLDCDVPGVPGPARCGSVTVPENRDNPGRTLALNVVVLEPTGPTRDADPLVPLQGGPGQPAVPMADFYARLFAAVRRTRAIVLVDVRGTGKSNPLNCEFDSDASLRSTDLLPLDAVRACRAALERHADLTRYTTPDIADDLEDVRRALGYTRWNLYGTSYGTRLALEYVRRHEASVRTMTLKAVVPPSMLIPFSYARDADAALQIAIDRCHADPGCRARAGDTRVHLAATIERLSRAPEEVRVMNREGREVTVTMGPGLFADMIRNMMYGSQGTMDALPRIRDAAAGELRSFAETVVRIKRSYSADTSIGLFLTVTCAEDVPFIDVEAVPSAVKGTFLGDFRIRQQIAACREWTPPSRLGRSQDAVVSDVPALLFSGDMDPVTPPRMGDEVVKTLRRGRHVVLLNNAHALGASSACVTGLNAELLAGRPASTLSVACAADAPLPSPR